MTSRGKGQGLGDAEGSDTAIWNIHGKGNAKLIMHSKHMHVIVQLLWTIWTMLPWPDAMVY